MPKYRVEIDVRRYHTVEEIIARNKDEAFELASKMYDMKHEGIIYDDQDAEIDFEVYPLDEE